MYFFAFHEFLRIVEITLVCTAYHVLQMSEVTFQKNKVLIHFQNQNILVVRVLLLQSSPATFSNSVQWGDFNTTCK